jgi:hypothetical protein
MPFVTGTITTVGDNNSVIAAPTDPNQHIIIDELVVQNEAATANTVILKNGNGGTAFWRQLLQNQGANYIHYPADPPVQMWELSIGAALCINLSAGTVVGYSISYRIK